MVGVDDCCAVGLLLDTLDCLQPQIHPAALLHVVSLRVVDVLPDT